MPSHDGEQKWEREKSPVSLPKRTLISSDKDPTLTTSFNLNYFCKDPVSEYSHTGGSGLHHMNGEGGHNSVHSRGLIFKIFNYWLQAPANQNTYLLSDASWTDAYQQNILDETKEAKSSLWPPPGKISTVHVKDSFCHTVHHPKMEKKVLSIHVQK